jgi:hypothetical protein
VAIEVNPTARTTLLAVRALHVRCQRGDDGKLKGLSFEAETGFYHSGWWDLSDDDAQALLGGWLYLHPPTSIKSELGGRIRDFSRAQIGLLPKGLLTLCSTSAQRHEMPTGGGEASQTLEMVLSAVAPHAAYWLERDRSRRVALMDC